MNCQFRLWNFPASEISIFEVFRGKPSSQVSRVGENVLKYSRNDLNNNGFGGCFFAVVGSNKKVTSLPGEPNDASRPWFLVQWHFTIQYYYKWSTSLSCSADNYVTIFLLGLAYQARPLISLLFRLADCWLTSNWTGQLCVLSNLISEMVNLHRVLALSVLPCAWFT